MRICQYAQSNKKTASDNIRGCFDVRNLLQQIDKEAEEVVLVEDGNGNQGDGGHDLDEDVQAGADGILQRIADGVANNGGIVCGRALAVACDGTGLDVLLGIVPSAAGVTGEDSQHDSGNGGTDEQTADELRSEDEAGNNGNEDSHESGDLHLADSTLGGDGDAGLVVGLLGTVEDTGTLGKLAADLSDHLTGSLGNGVDEHAGEEEGQRTADDGTGQRQRIDDVEDQIRGRIVVGVEEGDHQSQSCESAGADGEALTDSSGGVTDGVKGVGDLTDVLIQTAHLGDTAGVVGDGTVGVNGDSDGNEGEHTDSSHSYAVHTGDVVGEDDGKTENDAGGHAGLHTEAEALGDGEGRAFHGSLSELLGGLVVGAGVVLGNDTDEDTADDTEGGTDHGRSPAEGKVCGRGVGILEHEESGGCGEHKGQSSGEPGSAVKLSMGILADLLEEQEGNAEAAGDQTAGNNDEGEEVELLKKSSLHLTVGSDGEVEGEGNGRDDGADVALQQVGAETGNVTDVVTDVVGDGSGVAGVILGDVSLGLTDEVSTHVGSLGVDTAADTVEHSNDGAAQSVTGKGVGKGQEGNAEEVGDGGQLTLTQLLQTDAEDEVNEEQTEQSKTADAKAHNGAALEGDLQGLADVAGLVGLVGDADVGVGGDLHADKTGACAHNGAEEQSHTGMPGEQDGENDRNDDDDDGEDLILIGDKGACTDADGGGDLLHSRRAFLHLLHGEEVEGGEAQSKQCSHNEKSEHRHSELPFENPKFA